MKTIKQKVWAGGAAVSLMIVVCAGAGIWSANALINSKKSVDQASKMSKMHMQADMMHDAIRGDVLNSMLAVDPTYGIDPKVAEADLAFSGMSSVGGPAAVAAVLNLVSTSLEKEVLDLVAEKDASLSDEIKNLMFVFEDLITLDDKSLQRLLREVDIKQLTLALKTTSPELKTKIMQTMSQRAVAGLKEAMEFLGPVKMRDVEAAQTDIVSKVRALEESGEIVLSAGSDDVIV
jgi:hypothetical protein